MKKDLETVEEPSTIPKYCSKYPKLFKKMMKRRRFSSEGEPKKT